MKQTIGSTWILTIVIVFILLFAAFIILTLNYSRTVRVKNEIIDMVEKYEGLNSSSIVLINNYLLYSGYNTQGVCVDSGGDTTGVYGSYSLNMSTLEPAVAGLSYYYCVKKYNGANNTNYYQVTIFYRFNLPIIGDTGGFSIKGTTSNFEANDDSLYSSVIGS